MAAGHGVAVFGNLRIDRVGTGRTLLAAAGALSPSTSVAFDIVP